MKIIENLKTLQENHEDHENLKILCANHDNHENHRIPFRFIAFMKILEFQTRIMKIMQSIEFH